MREEIVGAATRSVRLPWRELYDSLADELLAYVWRLTGDREAATDLMQEVFLAGMRDERQLRDVRKVRAWLYKIATRLAVRRMRRARLIALLPFSGRESTGGDVPSADALAVRAALRRISPEQAVALVLHYAHGFTRAEIAEMSGRSEETIKSRIARGRRAFLAAYDTGG